LLASTLSFQRASAQNENFTPLEQQQISIETKGLFDRSNMFAIDFDCLPDEEYSFPLPVGKAEGLNNNTEVEITTTKGDAVKAMFNGVVRISRNHPQYGHVIVIRHDNGLETLYGCNAQNLVKVGQKVKAGQTIAIVGGKDDRVYCLFAIMVDGRRINPETIIDLRSHNLRSQRVIVEKQAFRIDVRTERKKMQDDGGVADADGNPFAKSDVLRLDLSALKSGEWAYPLPGARVISPYGGRRHHSGVDLKTKPNDNVLAAFPGVVTRCGPFSGYGNCIVIRHPNGLTTLYSHQSKNLVKVGQKVKAGQVIGLTGRTGRATTEHLHFEVHSPNGTKINPNVVFNHETRRLQKAILTIRKGGGITSKRN
jgi:murein DD-endopeptidase MepM/ murein hydrolase activator NlpD